MKTLKDTHTVTGSPLMLLEFIMIHTIIWSFVLCVLFYLFNLFLPVYLYLPAILAIPFYRLRMLLEWPWVMLTALILTVIRSFLRRTAVTLSRSQITIHRPRHDIQLSLADFVRPKTIESFINIHFVGWIFRRRYLIFLNDTGKEVRYRLYEFSEKDLEQVMQLITRVNRTERMDEDNKTQIMMESFQTVVEIPLNPRQILSQERRTLLITGAFALVFCGISTYVFYWMFNIPEQYDSDSIFLAIIGFGSCLLAFVFFLLLCYTLWLLATGTVRIRSCPQKIAFVGNMFQIDSTVYSVNRIRQIVMNNPTKKPALFSHYEIKIITMEGVHNYWLGPAKAIGRDTWLTLCRNMQNVLISCPSKLAYK